MSEVAANTRLRLPCARNGKMRNMNTRNMNTVAKLAECAGGAKPPANSAQT
jgi:hypothetical protein